MTHSLLLGKASRNICSFGYHTNHIALGRGLTLQISDILSWGPVLNTRTQEIQKTQNTPRSYSMTPEYIKIIGRHFSWFASRTLSVMKGAQDARRYFVADFPLLEHRRYPRETGDLLHDLYCRDRCKLIASMVAPFFQASTMTHCSSSHQE